MNKGELIYTNFFGKDNLFGVLIDVKKLPKDAIEYYTCKVFLSDGTIKDILSSYLLTMSDINEYGI